ncbi:hypothetical protein [Granulicella sp. S190]|uniref:hypothetical protein n=1 Tax=Granulicella sp. S190 TaxID=1747226 RepID=UPI00131B0014|nr:hypothetical protein [Granulicella sp. S190]
MKNTNRIIFVVTGAISGALLVALSRALPVLLVAGVGPIFICCALGTAWALGMRVSGWRALLAALLSVPAYLAALGTFAVTASYAQSHGLPASSLLSDMKPDVLLGLIAAVLVASLLLEVLAFLLSKHWSNLAAFGLLAGGMVAVVCSYAVHAAYVRIAGHPEGLMQILTLFGPLFIIGGAVTSGVIGEQMQKFSNRSVAAAG